MLVTFLLLSLFYFLFSCLRILQSIQVIALLKDLSTIFILISIALLLNISRQASFSVSQRYCTLVGLRLSTNERQWIRRCISTVVTLTNQGICSLMMAVSSILVSIRTWLRTYRLSQNTIPIDKVTLIALICFLFNRLGNSFATCNDAS